MDWIKEVKSFDNAQFVTLGIMSDCLAWIEARFNVNRDKVSRHRSKHVKLQKWYYLDLCPAIKKLSVDCSKSSFPRRLRDTTKNDDKMLKFEALMSTTFCQHRNTFLSRLRKDFHESSSSRPLQDSRNNDVKAMTFWRSVLMPTTFCQDRNTSLSCVRNDGIGASFCNLCLLGFSPTHHSYVLC